MTDLADLRDTLSDTGHDFSVRDQFGGAIVDAFDSLTNFAQPLIADIVTIIEAFEQSTCEAGALREGQMKSFAFKFFVGMSDGSHG